MRVIAAHGEVEAARRALLGRSSLRRARGAHLLGLVRDEESVPTLISLLSDPADDVRFVAARSLGHIGDPSALGIEDLATPDFGDAPDVRAGDLPVFWACGVTPQAMVMATRPELAICHAPGHMLITDRRDLDYVVP